MREHEKTIREIEQHRYYLTRQQFKTLIGQVKAGNEEEALRGLHRLLNKTR